MSILFFLFNTFSAIIPLKLARSWAVVLSKIAYYILPIRKKVALKNLKLCFPEKDNLFCEKTIKEVYENVFITIIEFFYMPRLSLDDLKKELLVENLELIHGKLNVGKGLLLCGAHFGNWEMMAHSFSRIVGKPYNVIIKEQRNKSSDKKINGIRTSHGNKIIPMQKALRESLRLLNEGGIVAMLSDQFTPQGIAVTFFENKIIFLEGVARIAVRKESPILFCIPFRNTDRTYSIEITEIIPLGNSEDEKIKNIIQQYASLLEAGIRCAHGHWLWFHRRFKSLISY